jgi:hypothetical protein
MASITALATGATQYDTRILERLVLPMRWNAARDSRMAERDALDVKIPAEGNSVV